MEHERRSACNKKEFASRQLGITNRGESSLSRQISHVIDIGVGPSPMLYFSANYYKSDGAIMVTGSHNPSEYNGFKMVLKKHSFYSEDIQNLQFLPPETSIEVIFKIH